jgi:hypothetical protein
MEAEPPCNCDPTAHRLCEEARGLREDLDRATLAGAPGPGVTTELGGTTYRRAFEQLQHHLRLAREFYRRRQ